MTAYTLMGVNFFICIGIVCCCICRLGAGDKGVLRRIRTFYLASGTVSLACAFGPILPTSIRFWPDVMFVLFAAVVFGGFLCDSYRWRHGPPADAKSDLAPLGKVDPK